MPAPSTLMMPSQSIEQLIEQSIELIEARLRRELQMRLSRILSVVCLVAFAIALALVFVLLFQPPHLRALPRNGIVARPEVAQSKVAQPSREANPASASAPSSQGRGPSRPMADQPFEPDANSARSLQKFMRGRELSANLKTLALQNPRSAVQMLIHSELSHQEKSQLFEAIHLNGSLSSTQALGVLAASQIRSAAEDQISIEFEIALRERALEAIESSFVGDGEASRIFNKVLITQNHPSLRFFTELSIEGIQQRRRGKLARFIERTFDNALNGKG